MKSQLLLSTVAFGIAFAVWGSVAGTAPLVKSLWGLSPLETGFLVALPVILGSLGRIPMGFLTDCWGARRTMTVTLAFSGMCALAIGIFHVNYLGLLILGSLLGASGTTFAIGVAHLSPWYPKSQQGSALGIFGTGNIGQSVAVFGIPWLARVTGSWKIGFILLGLLVLGWAVVYALKAREARPVFPGHSGGNMFRFFRSPMAWGLSTYYFLTFGGFLALSLYLPILLKDQFLLSPEEAGMRTAGFVVLATFMRPLGGWLSDRVGATRILFLVFLGIWASSLLLMSGEIGTFGIGATSFAISAGLGNGAVLKLVPHYFPGETGRATGLVGAAGGMGGFFPPLLMSFSLERYGHYLLGWFGLMFFSMGCLWVLLRMNSVASTKEEVLVS